MHILAVDVGTSSVKAAVLETSTAAQVGPLAHVAYELDRPEPEAAQIPSKRIWEAVARAAHQAVQTKGKIEGIGLSCLTPGLVLLDDAERPLSPIWIHL